MDKTPIDRFLKDFGIDDRMRPRIEAHLQNVISEGCQRCKGNNRGFVPATELGVFLPGEKMSAAINVPMNKARMVFYGLCNSCCPGPHNSDEENVAISEEVETLLMPSILSARVCDVGVNPPVHRN